MPSTFNLAPNPKWYFLNAFGRPAAGGSITTFSSLDHSTPKFVFSDPLGLFPYTDPIILDGTGGSPVPMFWENNGIDLYYVVVADAAGNIIFTIDNFPTTSGGITPITSNIDIENHLVNGQFLFIDAPDDTSSVITPVPVGVTHVAPGSGFFKDANGDYVPFIDPTLPSGWSFVKAGGAGATDTIEFVAVANIGVGIPNAPSANATRFFRFSLTGAGAVFTDAALTDVIPNVELFSGELLTISFETRADIGAPAGTFEVTQHFGTGGAPSADVVTSHLFNFSSGAFARQSFQFTVPSVVGKNKGTNLDDCLIFRWVFPLNTIGTFDLANLQTQRGTFGVTPYIEQTYAQDQYKVLIDLMVFGNVIFPTGQLKWMSVADSSGNPLDIPGWIVITNVNAGEFIGSDTSGAQFTGIQTRNLYVLWWNCFPQSEVDVAGGRGADALSDFNANKGMRPPKHILNTVLAGAGDGLFINASFGQFEGFRGFSNNTAQGGGTFTTIDTAVSGNNNMQPTFYLWLYVKL